MRKKGIKRLAACLAASLVLTGMTPTIQTEAASTYKKFPTYIRYTNKYGKAGSTADAATLESLLGSSTYEYVYLKNLKTSETYTIPANSKAASKRLRVNAPLSTLRNYATMKVIKISALDGEWHEYGTGNSFSVTDPDAHIVVEKAASVDRVYFKANNGKVNLEVNGDVSKTGFYGKDMDAKVVISDGKTGDVRVASEGSKVEITAEKDSEVGAVTVLANSDVTVNVNDGVEKVVVEAGANVTIKGDSETVKEVALEVKETAEGAKVSSDVPVKAEVAANAEVTLEKGAEGSEIKPATSDVKVELKTEEGVKTTTTDDGKIVVGEKKDDTTTTPGGDGTTTTPGGDGSGTINNGTQTITPGTTPGPVEDEKPTTPSTPEETTTPAAITNVTVKTRKETVADGQPAQVNDEKFTVGTIKVDKTTNTYTIPVQGTQALLWSKANENGVDRNPAGKLIGLGVTLTLPEGKDITSVSYKSVSSGDFVALTTDAAIKTDLQNKTFMWYPNVAVSADQNAAETYAAITLSLQDENGVVTTLIVNYTPYDLGVQPMAKAMSDVLYATAAGFSVSYPSVAFYQDGLTIIRSTTDPYTYEVKGTLNYIKGWKGFNESKTEEQSGHYLPICIEMPAWKTDNIKITANSKDFTKDVLDTYNTKSYFTIIWYVTEAKKDTPLNLTIGWNGDSDNSANTGSMSPQAYKIDLSDVTFAPATSSTTPVTEVTP